MAISLPAITSCEPPARSRRAIFGPVKVYGFLAMESFEELAEANRANPELCVRLLSEQAHSPRQRFIPRLSMHKLGVHQYVGFIQSMIQLRDNSLVSSDELERSLSSRLSDMIRENHADEEVQSTLKKVVIRDDISPAETSAIHGILSGDLSEKGRRFNQFLAARGAILEVLVLGFICAVPFIWIERYVTRLTLCTITPLVAHPPSSSF